MSDGASISPEMGLEPKVDSRKISLYKSSRFEVFVPGKPNIPLNEGLHVQVSSGHDESDSPKQVLARYLMAEGVAKILAESGQTRDAWANTRIEEGQRVSVYGRVPEEEVSWRKPVDTFDRNASPINGLEPFYETQILQELSTRYLPKWEGLVGKVELFENGVNGTDVDSSSGEEIPVWQNDKFTLVLVSTPHVKGVHLVVHPKESFRRQWQTSHVEDTLEATAIAMGVQKILAEGKGEIHNSGNWAGGLKSIEEGGKLDLEKLSENIKAEKKSHRPDIATDRQQINTGMHAHVYIPESGSVILPSMPRGEAIEKGRQDVIAQWDQIPKASPEQVNHVKSKLGQGKLTSWLEENCKGNI